MRTEPVKMIEEIKSRPDGAIVDLSPRQMQDLIVHCTAGQTAVWSSGSPTPFVGVKAIPGYRGELAGRLVFEVR